ncbi:metabolism of cobalamin associated Db [Genypterus blacodes]|uniref:metabolism of cobalamin associated Db n=1 Tax=Genypterus blacodes TaxID=154954 RepID=UPI003F76F27F
MACALYSRSRLVSYLQGIHPLVRRVRPTASDDARVAVTLPHLGMASVRPDETTGPSGPKDQRFQLPGNVGFDTHLDRVAEQKTHKIQPHLSFVPSETDTQDVILAQFIGEFNEKDGAAPPKTDDKAEQRFDMSSLESVLQSCSEPLKKGTEEDITVKPDKAEQGFNKPTVECALQPCPERLQKDFLSMFPEAPSTGMMVVTVTQKTQNDMTAWSAAVGAEREDKLHEFIAGAKEICSALEREGFWADFIDPSSGLAFFGAYTNNTLFETDSRYRHLGFQIEDLGCCKVISHSLWGTHVFVGTIFTNAPANSPIMNKMLGS